MESNTQQKQIILMVDEDMDWPKVQNNKKARLSEPEIKYQNFQI
ncbi:hypothetical protein [Acinetobacter shaoyimingii]|nr:hypothetical protein [Acinetobacter shaoyimingii]